MEVTYYISIEKLNTVRDIAELEHNSDAMRIEFGPNTPWGNHYHKKRTENFALIKGDLTAKYWPPESPNEILEVKLEVGDVVTVSPGLAHEYLSTGNAVALEFASTTFKASALYKH